ncbi:phage integrase SAM-like domain-containing protein [Flavobacterium xueshanense]|uniref:Phage integrase family protein n=1 Tax=Flavobacterium xueshanense TaxID=935223 RepID=A0A1I2H9V8_9FLAO|nr:phage integrase SAM-like domain-containing protein [Flavobacterium xueshanense]SFF26984.1 Phage integrase family protein [Flavobacterium xueshanense]
MATVKFLLQSKKENSNIYVRYSINRNIVLKRKTGFMIDAKDWSEDKSLPKTSNEDLKGLKSKLEKLALFINEAHNKTISAGIEFDGEWLQLQIDLYNNKIPVVDLDVLTAYIQKYIDEAPFKQNAKKGLGLSNGRVQNLKLFKKTIGRYEGDALNKKSILIKEIDLKWVEKYKMWLFNLGYSPNYVGKNIANVRTICLDASKNDIETSPQIKNIKGISESKEPEDIVFLSEEEQEAIKKAPLIREALINARKWLLLGCLIGQRGGDLLNITQKNIKEINGIKIIELKQQKTGKIVAIPLLPEAIHVIESGLPYKTSLVHFNEYIKDICEAAELHTPTKGRKKINQGKPNVKDTYPKYKMVSSHICRRSFATNFYGRIPTPILKDITGHGSERMFLAYIGKTSYDSAYHMLEYFSKLTPKIQAPPVMKVIRKNAE